ncbi:MAG: rod shape-determining protein MreC [Coprococcus sp.]
MKNNRKNRIKPKYILVLLVLFCLVCMGLSIFSGGSVPTAGIIVSSFMAPMQEGINSIGDFTSNLAEKRQAANTLEAENEALLNEVDNLKSKLTAMENNLSDYEDLLDLLALSEKYPTYETTGARIIAKDPGNWYSNFTINKGSADGIKKDMNVIAGNGLVGIVTQVNANSSVVRSIIDDTSNVSGMISKNRDICIVNGDLTLIDSGLLNVELISKESTVVDGDEVVTSYISDKYLPGLLIGYISDVMMDDSELTYNAKLTPVVDFQHLSNVLVIMQLKKDMDLSGNENGSTPVTETGAETETSVETVVDGQDE